MFDESEYFLGQDGLKLHYRFWEAPETEVVLCIIHGLGEHSGRYSALADYLNEYNISVYAVDLRGHGLSQGKKGHAKSYELLLGDVEELLKTARSEYTELPIFLMGHSMGGNIVANYMIRKISNDVSGFILSSPWLRLAFAPPAWKMKLGGIVGSFMPGITQSNGLEPSQLTRDPEMIKTWEADEWMHDKISAGLFNALIASGVYAITHALEIKQPGLAYHGTGDQVTHWQSTKEFAENGQSIEWLPLDKVRHEPHNDFGRKHVYELILEWIKKQARPSSS